MPGSCRVRFPFQTSIQNAGKGARSMYESCRGGSCSRSGSPQKIRPALWEPKPYPPCTPHHQCPARPQTAPTISVSATFHPPSQIAPPSHFPERPTSAQSARSYESCQNSNCSRSPCSTPRAFDQSVHPYEKPRSLSPPGWPYSSKRRTRRGRWWDKDWAAAERYTHFQNPDLQPCGCHKSRHHSRSRTPPPKQRSPRDIGLDYHYNRLANTAERAKFSRTPSPRPGRFVVRDKEEEKYGGSGHCHQYQNWSCGSSPTSSQSRSRSESPTFSGRSRTPSPSTPAWETRPYAPPKRRPPTPRRTPRQQTPARQRPQTPRQRDGGLDSDGFGGGGARAGSPFVNSHGHCHTYNAWSCTPSHRNTPRHQSPPESRAPTPPPAPRAATINISYTPGTAEQSTTTEDFSADLKGLRPAKVKVHGQQQQQSTPNSGCQDARHLFLSNCHCHHCHHSCPTCGHHGHHGPTLFTLAPHPPAFSCGCPNTPIHHHHHHHCHCFHHHHH